MSYLSLKKQQNIKIWNDRLSLEIQPRPWDPSLHKSGYTFIYEKNVPVEYLWFKKL